mgnify:CR=1 FL=1|tara:strand:- start:1648 stop:2445 length:798 start_codon:yes stop_codon:yes gene_type:complete
MTTEIDSRLEIAKSIATQAGELALGFFQDIGALVIESKGVQDMVSNADKDVETFVRAQLKTHFPDDGIVGEEHASVTGTSGYTWVIDPIDGTANFVNNIPAWCVILACVHDDETIIGVIYEPCYKELFWGAKGAGSFVNDRAMKVAQSAGFHDGNFAVGMSGRTESSMIVNFITKLTDKGGLFFRNASGGLSLAYVAAGRLIGYAEPHMNAWDCLAGQLLIAEAGGSVEQQSADDMLASGGRVVTSMPLIFDDLVAMSDAAFPVK